MLKNFKFLKNIVLYKLRKNLKINLKFFSENQNQDEKYWSEFTKRKSEQKEIQTLDTQFTKTKEFKFSSSMTLKPEEFIECLGELNRKKDQNFVIIDIRPSNQFNSYTLPYKTKVQRK